VLSNACDAKFSQYSTTDWFSNSYGEGHGSAISIDEGEKGSKSKRVNESYRHGRERKCVLGRKEESNTNVEAFGAPDV